LKIIPYDPLPMLLIKQKNTKWNPSWTITKWQEEFNTSSNGKVILVLNQLGNLAHPYSNMPAM
jgi:hypothetical protein